MAVYAVVQDADDVVVNVVEWDGEALWSPPPGTTAVLDSGNEAIIGGTYVDGVFYPPA